MGCMTKVGFDICHLSEQLVEINQVHITRHFFKKNILFIYFGGGHKQGEQETEKQAPHTLGSRMQGWIPGPWDYDPSQSQTLN